MNRVSVTDRSSPDARCAFCHDDLGEERAVCEGCRTVLHRDCRALLPECPTLGCRHSRFTVIPEGAASRPIESRPAYRRALARMAARQPDATGLTPIDDERAPPPGLIRWLARGLVRIAISPIAIPGLALLFAIFYTLLYWGSLGGDSSRDEERERRQAFVDGLAGWGQIELGLAPLVTLAAFASFVLGIAVEMPALALSALCAAPLGLAALLPPAISWWSAMRRAPRDVTRWVP